MTPWTVVCQAPLSIGFSRQEYWSVLSFLLQGNLPDSGIELSSPGLAGGFFMTEPPGKPFLMFQFSSVQSLSLVQLSVTPWTAAPQASLSITNSQSLLKLMSIETVVPSNHLILCHPLLLLPLIFPSIRVFSNELVLCIRWPMYWSFSFNISPSKNIQY